LEHVTAKGLNGTIEFDGHTVTIRRDGMLARGTHGTGTRTIPLAHVASVQWRSAGLTAGQLSLVMSGRGDAPMIRAGGRGAKAATTDPNTITFHRHRQRDFERVRDAIQAALSAPAPVQVAAAAPAPPPPPTAPAGWYPDPYGEHQLRYYDGSGWTEHGRERHGP
jgi:hypothetical protein